jgi:hypothetical protein
MKRDRHPGVLPCHQYILHFSQTTPTLERDDGTHPQPHRAPRSTHALIPARAGPPRPPSQLFDPGSGDLALLFDASRFPAAPFDSGPLLAALAPLGLRRGVDLPVGRPVGGWRQ